MSDLISLAVGIAAHRRINSIRSDIRSQKLNLNESELSAISMRQDIEKLYLVIEALWAIIKQTSNLTDDDFNELIRQIDLQDGKLDGRNTTTVEIRKCSNCGRTILRGQNKCTYCGEEIDTTPLFRHNGR